MPIIDLSVYTRAELDQLVEEVNAERLRRSILSDAPNRAKVLVEQVAREGGDPAAIVEAAQAAVEALTATPAPEPEPTEPEPEPEPTEPTTTTRPRSSG